MHPRPMKGFLNQIKRMDSDVERAPKACISSTPRLVQQNITPHAPLQAFGLCYEMPCGGPDVWEEPLPSYRPRYYEHQLLPPTYENLRYGIPLRTVFQPYRPDNFSQKYWNPEQNRVLEASRRLAEVLSMGLKI